MEVHVNTERKASYLSNTVVAYNRIKYQKQHDLTDTLANMLCRSLAVCIGPFDR